MSTLNSLTNDNSNNAFTISVTGSADAGEVNTLETKTSVQLNLTGIDTLTGTSAEIEGLYTLHDEAKVNIKSNVDITIDNTDVTVAEVNNIATQTGGTVTATINEGVVSTLTGLSETGHAYTITITDTALAANDLITLDGITTATITIPTNAVITGTIDQTTTIRNSTVSGSSNKTFKTSAANDLSGTAFTVSDTGVGDADFLANLKALDDFTSGAITASSATTFSGTASDASSVYSSSGITGLGGANETVTITSATSSAADLNTINSNLNDSGTINVSSVTALTGSFSDLSTFYDNRTNFTTPTNITSATLSSGAISDAGALQTLSNNLQTNVNSNFAIDLTNTTQISGSYSEVYSIVTGLSTSPADFSNLSGTALVVIQTILQQLRLII